MIWPVHQIIVNLWPEKLLFIYLLKGDTWKTISSHVNVVGYQQIGQLNDLYKLWYDASTTFFKVEEINSLFFLQYFR